MELADEVRELRALVEVLSSKIDVLETEHAALKAENAVLKSENSDFRARLGLHSGTSHKPPSSDGFSKKPSVGLPKVGGKKNGGQVGHWGHCLSMVEQPDERLVHHAPACPYCGRIFSACQVETLDQKRQVVDIPAPKLVVVEHQLGSIRCCGQRHWGEFPAEVKPGVHYGIRIQAMSSLLNTDFRLPLQKISRLFLDLYGCSYTEATVLTANERLYEALVPVEEAIQAQLLASEVLHLDETGLRVAGKLHWVHTACSALFCYLFVHPNRGKKALQSADSLLPAFTHWAMHDCWGSYFHFPQVQHALCNAHLLRELTALQEQGSQWAAQMHTFLLDLYQASEKGRHVVEDKLAWIERYQLICQQADRQEPPPQVCGQRRAKNTKGRNLLNRLIRHQEAVLAFAFHKAVPFTNNLAEQAIRCVKIKQKVAMSLRTFKGAQIYARIQGFVTTCRKQGLTVFAQLLRGLDNKKPDFLTTS